MSKKICFFIIIAIFFVISELHALEKATHYSLNGTILEQSGLDKYFQSNLGFAEGIKQVINGKRVKIWLQEGGPSEDEPAYTRSRNHFHDPLKSWGQAGLSSFFFTGISSALWIQDQTNRRWTDLGGDWSWKKARQFYYAALTGDSTALNGFTVDEGFYNSTTIAGKTNMSEAERSNFFAWTFRAVGQTMHLVEDASVPAHTRNDVHLLYNYEDKVEDIRNSDFAKFQSFISQPVSFSGTIAGITSFIDTNQYSGNNPAITAGTTVGLAEYTNANFVSEDTIFTSDYTYPSKTSSVTVEPYDYIDPFNPGRTIKRKYYKKRADGETRGALGYRLAAAGRLPVDPGSGGNDGSVPLMDDYVYEDYAQLLLPRAVGYSAGLLNYFFRGEIEITLSDKGIYAATDANGSFNKIQLKVRNITATGEEMTSGTIQLVVKYKIAQEDPFRSDLTEPVERSEDFTYTIVAANSSSIPRDSPIELTFDLSQPIPLWATDVTLQIVYRGQLGNEQDAVAVGFKDTSEPTPFDVINNADYTCINGTYYQSGSDEAINSRAKPPATPGRIEKAML